MKSNTIYKNWFKIPFIELDYILWHIEKVLNQ